MRPLVMLTLLGCASEPPPPNTVAAMLVMDLSSSMMTGDTTDPRSPVNLSRLAAEAFVDRLADAEDGSTTVGLALYAERAVRAPTDANPSGTTVRSEVPDPVTDPPWLPLTRVTDDLVTQRLGGICETGVDTPCLDGQPHPTTSMIGYRTNPGPALEQAVNELAGSPEVAPGAARAIVFFSDGWPNAGGGAGAVGDAVDRAWDERIQVFPILFANGGGDPEFAAAQVRGPEAYVQITDTQHLLPALFTTVADSLLTAPAR